MNRHLQDISDVVPAGRQALIVLDGAGWHRAKALHPPANVSLLIQSPYSPELNPVEQVFSFLTSNYFANRVFATLADVHDTVRHVWSDFARSPERITSIGTRDWRRSLTLTVDQFSGGRSRSPRFLRSVRGNRAGLIVRRHQL